MLARLALWKGIVKTFPNIPDTDYNGKDSDYGYVVISRPKKNAPWKAIASAKCGGRCCQNMADRYFENLGFVADFTTLRVVDDREWASIQTRQHLKAIKMKQR